MKEYLEVADLRTSLPRLPLPMRTADAPATAPLTEDEIAAIDEAGKNGPPSTLRVLLYRAQQRWILLLMLVALYLFVLGPVPLVRLSVPVGCHRS